MNITFTYNIYSLLLDLNYKRHFLNDVISTLPPVATGSKNTHMFLISHVFCQNTMCPCIMSLLNMVTIHSNHNLEVILLLLKNLNFQTAQGARGLPPVAKVFLRKRLFLTNRISLKTSFFCSGTPPNGC